ncbi:glycosyltransferase [Candidatus Gottesmanbacteria bacterium]|nr:glycosyltransferase [Candidatus Gottesmanbacteria bacterium]
MNFPLVSIVIPTLNEEKNIGRCLESILDQTYKNIEIIVVDNNSKDKT